LARPESARQSRSENSDTVHFIIINPRAFSLNIETSEANDFGCFYIRLDALQVQHMPECIND
jgi:hypothetical protein